MAHFNCIGPILQNGETEEEALDFLHNYDFSEDEITPESIKYYDYIASHQGIDLYYDYGADYYFFATEESPLEESKKYKNMKKNVIRLTESQLRKVVNNSVKRVLREMAEPQGPVEYINVKEYESGLRKLFDKELQKICTGEYEQYYDMLYDMLLDESDTNEPERVAEKMNEDMKKYLHMDDHNMAGNFKNIRYDWEGIVGDNDNMGYKLKDVVAMLDNGEDNEVTRAFKEFATTWLWEAFGTFGLTYNFGDTVYDILDEWEQEDKESD